MFPAWSTERGRGNPHARSKSRTWSRVSARPAFGQHERGGFFVELKPRASAPTARTRDGCVASVADPALGLTTRETCASAAPVEEPVPFLVRASKRPTSTAGRCVLRRDDQTGSLHRGCERSPEHGIRPASHDRDKARALASPPTSCARRSTKASERARSRKSTRTSDTIRSRGVRPACHGPRPDRHVRIPRRHGRACAALPSRRSSARPDLCRSQLGQMPACDSFDHRPALARQRRRAITR